MERNIVKMPAMEALVRFRNADRDKIRFIGEANDDHSCIKVISTDVFARGSITYEITFHLAYDQIERFEVVEVIQ